MTELSNPHATAAVDAAITSRRSVRGFLPTEVPRQTIEDILQVAARAPSGTNTQPWKVTVLTGEAKTSLSAKIGAVFDDPAALAQHHSEYEYYPTEWRSPYIERRRKVGWDLYTLLGIGKTDKHGMHRQHGRNYEFFGAPVGLIFTIERVLRQGSWLDYGMFLQSVMVAARGRGPGHLPAGGVHAVPQDHHGAHRRARQRHAGVRHVAGPCRPCGGRQPAGHRARAGGRVRSFPVLSLGAMANPQVLVARAVFDDVIERLREYFDVQHNQADEVWTQDELIRRLQGKTGVFVTGTESIDARLLDACPALRAVCSMAVGYNNIDVAACTERGVLVSNAPDVLTETTADFGFALMMAAARRIAESEHYLRAGKWTRWGHDMFAGADVHGATLGVLGMGRIGQAIARRGALGFGMPVIYHNRSRLDAAGRIRARRALRGQGPVAARMRPPDPGAALWSCIAPQHRRGRTGADETHRHADQHRARRHRRRRGAGAMRCASGASPRPGWTCSKASLPCTPIC